MRPLFGSKMLAAEVRNEVENSRSNSPSAITRSVKQTLPCYYDEAESDAAIVVDKLAEQLNSVLFRRARRAPFDTLRSYSKKLQTHASLEVSICRR